MMVGALTWGGNEPLSLEVQLTWPHQHQQNSCMPRGVMMSAEQVPRTAGETMWSKSVPMPISGISALPSEPQLPLHIM